MDTEAKEIMDQVAEMFENFDVILINAYFRHCFISSIACLRAAEELFSLLCEYA